MVYFQNGPDWPTNVEQRIILKGSVILVPSGRFYTVQSQSWVELECPRTKEDVIASKRFTGEREDCTTKETLNIREKTRGQLCSGSMTDRSPRKLFGTEYLIREVVEGARGYEESSFSRIHLLFPTPHKRCFGKTS